MRALAKAGVLVDDPGHAQDLPTAVRAVFDAVFGARVGAGLLVVSCLDHSTEAGRYLLGRLLAGKLAHVNLIPLNPTPGSKWDASPLPAQREFVARLRAALVWRRHEIL